MCHRIKVDVVNLQPGPGPQPNDLMGNCGFSGCDGSCQPNPELPVQPAFHQLLYVEGNKCLGIAFELADFLAGAGRNEVEIRPTW
jgi:hypothetical protein